MKKLRQKLKQTIALALLLALALSLTGCVFKSSRPTDEQVKLSVEKLIEHEESLLKCREKYTYEVTESSRDAKGITLGILITAELQRSIMTVALSQRWRKLDDVWVMQSYEITGESVRVLQQPTKEEILAVFSGSDAHKKLSANYPDSEKNVTVSSVSWEDGHESAVAQITEEIVCYELVNVIYQSEQSLLWNRDDESWISAGTSINTDYTLWLKQPPTDEEIQSIVTKTFAEAKSGTAGDAEKEQETANANETKLWTVNVTKKEWEKGSTSCAARVTLSKDYTSCSVRMPYVYNLVWNEDIAGWECESYKASPTEPVVYDFTNLNGIWADKSNSDNAIKISGAGRISFLPSQGKPVLSTTVSYNLSFGLTSSGWTWYMPGGVGSDSGGEISGTENFSWSLNGDGSTVASAKLKKNSCEYSFYITADGIRAVSTTGNKSSEITLKKEY